MASTHHSIVRLRRAWRRRVLAAAPGIACCAGPLAVTLLAGLAGCHSGAPPAQPKTLDVRVTIQAAVDLNPNQYGRASPVLLHVYQLREAAKFQNADFEAATARAESTFGSEVVRREEQMIAPNSTTELHLKIQPEARLLGVIAEYIDQSNAQWRALSAVPEGGLMSFFKKQTFTIQLGGRTVTLTAGPLRKEP
jgi:type VI secretion system protein VasD